MAVLQIWGLSDYCESRMGDLTLGTSQKVLLSCLGALYLTVAPLVSLQVNVLLFEQNALVNLRNGMPCLKVEPSPKIMQR